MNDTLTCLDLDLIVVDLPHRYQWFRLLPMVHLRNHIVLTSRIEEEKRHEALEDDKIY